MRFFAILLIGLSAIAQKPIAMRLEKIQASDADANYRTFTISYSIENQSRNAVAFFLNPEPFLVPQISSSSSTNTHYRLFQNEKPVDAPFVFEFASADYSPEEIRRITDSIKPADRNPDRLTGNPWIQKQSLMRMNPGQTQSFKIVMRWDRKRYQAYDENEYYLDPSAKFELELSMHLMKEELRPMLTAAGIADLLNDAHLITGWFTSNRVRINLSE